MEVSRVFLCAGRRAEHDPPLAASPSTSPRGPRARPGRFRGREPVTHEPGEFPQGGAPPAPALLGTSAGGGHPWGGWRKVSWGHDGPAQSRLGLVRSALSGPAASAAPGNLLKMRTRRPHPGPAAAESRTSHTSSLRFKKRPPPRRRPGGSMHTGIKDPSWREEIRLLALPQGG